MIRTGEEDEIHFPGAKIDDWGAQNADGGIPADDILVTGLGIGMRINGSGSICFCTMMFPELVSMAVTRLSMLAMKTVSKVPRAPKSSCGT